MMARIASFYTSIIEVVRHCFSQNGITIAIQLDRKMNLYGYGEISHYRDLSITGRIESK